MKIFGSSDIRLFVGKYFRSLNPIVGKTVVDIVAGTGETAKLISDLGAHVEAYDLFPEFFQAGGLQCKKADLAEALPIDDSHADIVLCQEGIEHLPDQLGALREFNRILKPGGKLIVTTPNISHLRAKLSYFLVESEMYNKMPISESDAVWFSGNGGKEVYYGHVFLIGVQKLKILAKLAGFEIKKIHPVKISRTSLLLGVFFPVILLVNLFAYLESIRRGNAIDKRRKKAIYREALRLNLNPKILFGKHLFIEFEKTYDKDDVGDRFYKKYVAKDG